MMANDETALIAAIAKAAPDDGPRIKYARWLQGQGDVRGDFIMAQCEYDHVWETMAQPGLSAHQAAILDGRLAELQKIQQSLLEQHEQEFLRPLQAIGIDRATFIRGMPESLVVADPILFAKHIGLIHQLAPTAKQLAIHVAALDAPQIEAIRAIFQSPPLACFEGLTFLSDTQRQEGGQGQDGNIVAAAAAVSPYLENLRTLSFDFANLGPAGVAALFHSVRLPRLERLSFFENPIGQDGIAAIAAGPGLPSLKSLSLRKCGLNDNAAAGLASASHLHGLRELNLADNSLGQDTIMDLLKSKVLADTFIEVDTNHLPAHAARAISQLISGRPCRHPHLSSGPF